MSRLGDMIEDRRTALTESSSGLIQPRHRLGPVLHLQLAQDVFNVLLDRAFGNEQPRCDGGIGATQSD